MDLLLVGTVGLSELALPLRRLEETLQIPVNVTHYTMEEFQEKLRKNNHFLRAVLDGEKIILKGLGGRPDGDLGLDARPEGRRRELGEVTDVGRSDDEIGDGDA